MQLAEHLSIRFALEQFERGEVKVLAFDQDDQKQLAEGKLLLINNQIDQTTSTIQLKAEFANDDTRLWPGQFVNVTLTLGMQADAVVVPIAAVQIGTSG